MSKAKKKKILIIEDEQTLAKSLSDKLTREGYEVIAEIDGAMGLKRVIEEMPDLVILDIILPGLNGLEVLKSLKGRDKTKNVPVILVSNVDDMKSTRDAKKLGAANYLLKSNVTLANIIEEIKKHIK